MSTALTGILRYVSACRPADEGTLLAALFRLFHAFSYGSKDTNLQGANTAILGVYEGAFVRDLHSIPGTPGGCQFEGE